MNGGQNPAHNRGYSRLDCPRPPPSASVSHPHAWQESSHAQTLLEQVQAVFSWCCGGLRGHSGRTGGRPGRPRSSLSPTGNHDIASPSDPPTTRGPQPWDTESLRRHRAQEATVTLWGPRPEPPKFGDCPKGLSRPRPLLLCGPRPASQPECCPPRAQGPSRAEARGGALSRLQWGCCGVPLRWPQGGGRQLGPLFLHPALLVEVTVRSVCPGPPSWASGPHRPCCPFCSSR